MNPNDPTNTNTMPQAPAVAPTDEPAAVPAATVEPVAPVAAPVAEAPVVPVVDTTPAVAMPQPVAAPVSETQAPVTGLATPDATTQPDGQVVGMPQPTTPTQGQ